MIIKVSKYFVITIILAFLLSACSNRINTNDNPPHADENLTIYELQELLDKFKETRRQIRPAVERLLDEARLAAQGHTSSETYEDIFGSEAD